MKNLQKFASFFCIALVLCISFVSCGMSVEDIITDYNSDLFDANNIESETVKSNRVLHLDSLLNWTTQTIEKGQQLRASVSAKYMAYKWSLTDAEGNSYSIDLGVEFVYVNTQELGLAVGTYTLTIQVTNKIGNIYEDSAKIVVS